MEVATGEAGQGRIGSIRVGFSARENPCRPYFTEKFFNFPYTEG